MIVTIQSNDTLTSIQGLGHGYCYRCPYLESCTQNAALAEVEGGRLCYFWRVVVFTLTGWYSMIRA
jgi:hypothetical protein